MLGLSFLLLLVNIRYYYLYMGTQMLSELKGTGFNDACSQKYQTRFDRSVCEDGRLDGMFFLYLDGTPFHYYKDFLTSEEFRDVATGRVSDNAGINGSGPSFRTSIIGRYDVEHIHLMADLDNHLYQYLSSINKNISSCF